MNKYCCPDCNREFKKKCHLDDHLTKKKKPCVAKKVDNELKIDDLKESLTANDCIIAGKPEKIPAKNCSFPANGQDKVTHSETIMLDDEGLKNNTLRCDYCNATFTRKDNLTKHINERCKNKKHIDNIDDIKSKLNDKIVILSEKYEKIEDDNKKLIEILEEYKHFIKENNLIKHAIPSTNNSHNISVNNGAINNGTVNNTTVTNIVQFGKEDISKCNLIEMMNIYLKSTGGNIFPNILKYLNFNPNFPENYNILMGDLSRENVKIHDGTKFVTKKFKNVEGDILNSLSNHIAKMCDSYVENPKTKKSEDILGKIKINNISVKLINNDDITPLLTIKKEKEKIKNEEIEEIEENKSVDSAESDESDEYLDLEGEKKLVHYENKRRGLQEITTQKLKDELYNNKGLVEKHHKITS